jgi:hypothetical protein
MTGGWGGPRAVPAANVAANGQYLRSSPAMYVLVTRERTAVSVLQVESDE